MSASAWRGRATLRALAAPALALALGAAALAYAQAPAPAPAPRAAAPGVTGVPEVESAPLRTLEGASYLSAADLARLLRGTRYWRADVRKLVVRSGAHRIVLTVDGPFALVDERTFRLDAPVRSVGGEIVVPVSLVAALPRDSALARLVVEPRRGRVVVVPAEGPVGTPRVSVAGDLTRVTIPCERPGGAQVTARSRGRFRVRVPGAWTGAPGDSLPPEGLVLRAGPAPGLGGASFEFVLAPAARGFRVAADSAGHRLVLEFARAPLAGLEPFAAEGPAGPRAVRVVVLDPAHGGTDAGVQAGGVAEKDLTLALARALAGALERRLAARVVLTRTDDRLLPVEARAEAANRARADLVLVLHFDGFTAPLARGATAYCAPATEAAGTGDAGALAVIPWRDVALRHAVDSRACAEALVGALAARGAGPVRLRETLPLHLLGVNAPGVSLECATLTNDADRARVTAPGGIEALATAIAEGVAAWQRNE